MKITHKDIMTTTYNTLFAPIFKVQEAVFKNRSKMALFLLLTTVGLLGTISMKNSGVVKKTFSSQQQLQLDAKNFSDTCSNFSGIFLGVVTATVGLKTYSNSQNWKRREYVDSKFKEFNNQLETINVRKMLETELQCIELFPFASPEEKRHVIVRTGLWLEALSDCKSEIERLKEFDDAEQEYLEKSNKIEKFSRFEILAYKKAAIRDNFNTFLNSIQQFQLMLESKTVDFENIKIYLNPWIQLISNIDNSDAQGNPRENLLKYMGLSTTQEKEDLSNVQKDVRDLFSRCVCLYNLKDCPPKQQVQLKQE